MDVFRDPGLRNNKSINTKIPYQTLHSLPPLVSMAQLPKIFFKSRVDSYECANNSEESLRDSYNLSESISNRYALFISQLLCKKT